HEISAASSATGWLKAGGRALAIGLDQAEANSFLPTNVTMKSAEHIAAWFAPFSSSSVLAGVAPADVHNRDPHTWPLVLEGGTTPGDGVMATVGNVVLCQLVPWRFSQSPQQFNQRRTFARTSFAIRRLLGNLGVSNSTPLLERFTLPVAAS